MDMPAEPARTALTGVRDEGNRPRVASDSLRAGKRIHEALATPGWPGVRSQSWDGAADQPPFRCAKRRPLAIAERPPALKSTFAIPARTRMTGTAPLA